MGIDNAQKVYCLNLRLFADLKIFEFRSNVGHASTCNSVGQTAGYFLGYVLFMALESADFCNTYLRAEPLPQGILTLSGM